MEPSERVFDWVSRHDPDSRRYPVRRLMPEVVEPRERRWKCGPVLDQGREGACVGFAWTAEMLATPEGNVSAPVPASERYARDWYRAAQRVDEWEGERYEGTSVLAGAKVGVDRELYESYRWAFSIAELRDAIILLGPVVIGIDWSESMSHPRPSGLLEVHGPAVGGHALLVYGYHPRMRIPGEGWFRRHEVYFLRQSWGARHGNNGNVIMHAGDLAERLERNGEACLPTGRHPVPALA